MKLFITGGTGFIGSNFIEYANSKGIDIIALKRKESYPVIELSNTVKWVEGELDSFSEEKLSDCTHFIHFASYGVFDQSNWEKCFKTNVLDSLIALKRGVKAGINKFIIIGSCFEYGISAMDYEKIPTTAPLKPINAYSASKAAASIAISALLEEAQKKYTVLRLFHVYGKGEREGRFWPSLCKAAMNGEDFDMTSGEQIRSFSNVTHIVENIYECLYSDDSKHHFRNLGSDNPTSLKEFAEYWWKKLNAKGKLKLGALPYPDDEIMRYIPNLDY